AFWHGAFCCPCREQPGLLSPLPEPICSPHLDARRAIWEGHLHRRSVDISISWCAGLTHNFTYDPCPPFPSFPPWTASLSSCQSGLRLRLACRPKHPLESPLCHQLLGLSALPVSRSFQTWSCHSQQLLRISCPWFEP